MEAGERSEEEGGEAGVEEGPARRQGVARAARLYREVVGLQGAVCRVQGIAVRCRVQGAGNKIVCDLSGHQDTVTLQDKQQGPVHSHHNLNSHHFRTVYSKSIQQIFHRTKQKPQERVNRTTYKVLNQLNPIFQPSNF